MLAKAPGARPRTASRERKDSQVLSRRRRSLAALAQGQARGVGSSRSVAEPGAIYIVLAHKPVYQPRTGGASELPPAPDSAPELELLALAGVAARAAALRSTRASARAGRAVGGGASRRPPARVSQAAAAPRDGHDGPWRQRYDERRDDHARLALCPGRGYRPGAVPQLDGGHHRSDQRWARHGVRRRFGRRRRRDLRPHLRQRLHPVRPARLHRRHAVRHHGNVHGQPGLLDHHLPHRLGG